MASNITITFKLTYEQVGPFMTHFSSYLTATREEEKKDCELSRFVDMVRHDDWQTHDFEDYAVGCHLPGFSELSYDLIRLVAETMNILKDSSVPYPNFRSDKETCLKHIDMLLSNSVTFYPVGFFKSEINKN